MASSLRAAATKRHVLILLSVTQEPARGSAFVPWPGEPESLVVTVDTGDRIHFLDWGSAHTDGSPLAPLVLVHGLGSTSWVWTPIARRLRAFTHVVAVDLRGHGLSDSPRDG